MAIGPVPNQAYHHHHHHHHHRMKPFVFFPKSIIMAAAVVLWVFSVGLATIIIFPFLFLYNTIKNCCCTLDLFNRQRVLPRRKALHPTVVYNIAEFPIISDCSICLEYFKEGDDCSILPACKHLFHSTCVKRWIQKRPTCPVCRGPVH